MMGRARRPTSLPLIWVGVLLLAIGGLSLAGPAGLGEAMGAVAAQWWRSGWERVKQEGSQWLPAIRAYLEENPALPRYWLGQGGAAGFSGAQADDRAAADAAAALTQETRALLGRVIDYDVADPKVVLARHLPNPLPGEQAMTRDLGALYETTSQETSEPVRAEPRPESIASESTGARSPVDAEGGVPTSGMRPTPIDPRDRGARPVPVDPDRRSAAAADRPDPTPTGQPSASTEERDAALERAMIPENSWMAGIRRTVNWGAGPLVAILHSHTSEMYRTDAFFPPHPDDYHRFNTSDTGIVQVGEAIAARLRGYGIGVVHSRRVHDWPVHALAYRRSRETVQELIERYPSLRMILDVHRDSPEGLTAVVAGRQVGQIMLLIGSGEQGRVGRNPTWESNLRLARRLEDVMEHRFPGLHRRTWVRADARFNQDLHPGMLLVEVGSYDTHIDEALGAAQMLGDAIAELLWRERAGSD